MHSRVEQAVIGFIVLLVGVFIIMGGQFSFDASAIMLIGLGVGFVLMYVTKRKSWALVIGAYMACAGITASLEYGYGPNIVIRLSEYMRTSLITVTTGIICLALFYGKNKRGLLIPGVLILCACAKWFVRDVLLINYRGVSVFILAAGFYIIYLFGSYFLGRWPKTVSAILFISGLITIVL